MPTTAALYVTLSIHSLQKKSVAVLTAQGHIAAAICQLTG